MNAIRRLSIAVAAAALSCTAAAPVLAADSVTVTAQVSMAAPCLTVSTTSVDFGVQMFSPDGDVPWLVSRPVSFANCGEAVERIFARGTNASEVGGDATWSLVVPGAQCPALGLNRFSLVARATGSDIDVTLAPQDRLLDLVGPGSGGQFDQLRLQTPCQGSDGSGSTMSFQVIFTATF